MKLFLCVLFGFLSLGVVTAQQGKEDTANQTQASDDAELAFVPSKLKGMKQLNDAKLKTDAKYFIFLSSASWCGPCRQEAPHIAKAYSRKISKDKDVELVLLSSDNDEEAAKEWAKKEKMTFPIMFDRSRYGDIPAVKEHSAGYIPHMLITDSEGKLVAKVTYIEDGKKKYKAIVDADGKVLDKGGIQELVSKYTRYCK